MQFKHTLTLFCIKCFLRIVSVQTFEIFTRSTSQPNAENYLCFPTDLIGKVAQVLVQSTPGRHILKSEYYTRVANFSI